MILPTPSIAMVKRELLTSLRSKRTFGLLTLTVAVLFALVMLTVGVGFGRGGSTEFFTLFVAILSAAACVFMTPVAATSICVEKQQGTFDLLRATLIRPPGIIVAKLLNVFAVFALIVIATMPLVGVLFFFVGVEWTQFLSALTLVFMLALACGAIGILCSAYFHRSLAAIAVSYVLLLGFLGVPVGLLTGAVEALSEVHLISRSIAHDLEGLIEATLAVWCPPAVMLTTILNGPEWGQFVTALVAQSVFILLCLLIARRILWRAARPMRVDTRKTIADARVLERRRKKFPYYLVDPLRRREPIADGRNPVFVKELCSGFLTKSTARIRLAYVCTVVGFVIACFPLGLRGIGSFADILAGALILQSILVLVMTPAMFANTMAKEHELGNLDMLRTTLLKPREIVLGKLKAGLASLSPLIVGSLLGMTPAILVALVDAKARAVCFTTFGTMFAGVLLLSCLSLRVAMKGRHTTTTLVRSYLAGILLFVFLPILFLAIPLYLEFFYGGRYWRAWNLEESLLFYLVPSPIAVQIANFEQNMSKSLINPLWLCNIGSCLFFSFLFVLSSIRVYARRIARDR